MRNLRNRKKNLLPYFGGENLEGRGNDLKNIYFVLDCLFVNHPFEAFL
jgi:hypothetical protein